MTFREKKDIIETILPDLSYSSVYVSGADKPYTGKNLEKLRHALLQIEDLDAIQPEIERLRDSALFTTVRDEEAFKSSDDTTIKTNLEKIKLAIDLLFRISRLTPISEESVFIKLPEIINFDDLGKLSNDLKKAVEIPIIDQNKGGYVKIETAESGSIWLAISLGTIAAVNLVGGICWASAVIRKKKAEAKIFEEHAKTLELKNDSMQIFVDAQKLQIKNMLESEAEELAKQHYSATDPEAIERLKLSINTVGELIEKGTKILPASDNVETLHNFPDYSKLNMIESQIKKISNN